MMSLNLVESISETIKLQFTSIGLEHYSFKIGWYNDLVSKDFQLPYHYDTLAFVILSSPDMFENAFIPFVRNHWETFDNLRDPIDQCMIFHFNKLKNLFPDNSIEIIHDFELRMPQRKPKVLVQTAAHVSGAAYYYKPNNNYINNDNRMIGVCIHPQYGGWFGIRGVIIFKDITASLKKVDPQNVIKSENVINDLLYNFNFLWKNSVYRDVIPVTKRYSDLQIRYFALNPKDRRELIKSEILINNVQNI